MNKETAQSKAVLKQIFSKPIVFHFDPALKELAKAIMQSGYVAAAIAKFKVKLGDVLGYEVHLTKGTDADLNGRKKADFDLNVYPLTQERLRELQQAVHE